jgi:HK97 family phage prohead protease
MTDTIVHKIFVGKAGDDPLEYVMSDGTVDRMDDVIEPDGWSLTNFKKSPIALFGHDSKFFIGNWSNVRVDKNELRGRMSLLDAVSDRLREIHAAVNAKILRAVSVGFRELQSEPRQGSKVGGVRYIKQELIECSLVSIPANPNALAVAKSLNISRDVQSLIFAEHGTKRQTMKSQDMDDFIKLTSLDRWSPFEARNAKLWLAELAKQHPFNPMYRKLHRLMDEIETVRTVSLVSAEHGSKGRAI